MDYKEAIEKYLRKLGYEKFAPAAALIDMDGTLYDSMRNHASAWVSVAQEAGWVLAPEEVYFHEGRTGAMTINELVKRTHHREATDEEKKHWYHRKTEYFNQLPAVEPMPGALEMLHAFSDRGIKRVLVTGSGQSSLISRLPSDFPGMFDPSLYITSADVKVGKPAPEPYLMAMQKAGDLKPWQAIVVENAPMGVQAGVASNAFTVGVVTGPIDRREFEKLGADLVFDSMPDFAAALPEILSATPQS